jgi:nucleotide-binding universal stress UspA family protein
MSYATLMVYVDADHFPDQRIRLAAGLADKFSATLIGLSALAIRPPFVAEGVVIVHSVTELDINEMTGKLADTENRFRGVAGAEHRKLEWRSMLDFPIDALTREARSADLIVIGQSRGLGDVYRSLDSGRAVLGMGRPTLIVPDGVTSLRADHIVIGWKDTREARRAVQDSLPFFHEATRVTIVEICGADDKDAARGHVDDVVRYLTRHRIKCGPRIVVHQEGSGAAQLIKLAQDEGADLLVTGAYGHSRLNEWIFGGITRDLLTTSPICCLLSH